MDPADPAAHPRPIGRPEAWRRLGAGGFLRDVLLGSRDGLAAAAAFITGVSTAAPGSLFAVGPSEARLTRRPRRRAGLEMSNAGGVGTGVWRAIAKGIAAL